MHRRAGHLKQELSEKETEISKLKDQTESLRASCETHAANIRKLKKSLTLVSWVNFFRWRIYSQIPNVMHALRLQERNDLRRLIDSYQKEVTINSDVHNQFDCLQRVIDGYKERVAQLENDPLLAVPSGTIFLVGNRSL